MIRRVVLLFSVLLAACSTSTVESLVPTGTMNTQGREASGIVYVQSIGTYFLVSDEGGVAEVDGSGSVVQEVNINGENFEGITFNPMNGFLYAVIEGKDRMLEIDPQDLSAKREFSINRKLDGEKVTRGGKEGFEGIAFVPNASHPEGGTFFVVNQATGASAKPEPSAILEVELPLVSEPEVPEGKKALKGNIVGGYVPGILGLSDISFDASTNHLLVISDVQNTFLEATTTGDIVAVYQLPGENQEGITVDAENHYRVVEDHHSHIRYLRLQKPQKSV